jgi:hypothetical protein
VLGTFAGEQVLNHRRSQWAGQMQTRAEEQLCPSANDVIWREGVLRHERLRNESASAKVEGRFSMMEHDLLYLVISRTVNKQPSLRSVRV